jgi:glycosyltransferase involved in cell wall biosynthesis
MESVSAPSEQPVAAPLHAPQKPANEAPHRSVVEPLVRPLKIALLGYRSNPYSGGQGIYIKYLSKALVDLGHQVDVISGEPYPELDPRVTLIKLPGLNLFEAPNHVTALRPQHFRSLTDLTEYFSMLTGGFSEPYTFGRRLVKYLRRHRPHYDVIHDNQSLCWGLLKLERLGYPVLATVHHPITRDREIALASAPGWRDRLLIRRWHSFLNMQTKVARQLPLITTVSECSKRDIIEAFDVCAERITVVHNGIDIDTFQPVADAQPDRLQLITTASADQPLKGTRHLLHALRELADHYPDIRLIMIGKLKPGGVNERLIEQLGLGPHIEFHHNLSSEDIRQLYGRASIAVVPSEYEGFGLPAGEAMACETAVVATDGGALPEVVGDAGLVVPAKDAKALAAAIRRLIENDAERADFARRGRQRIVEQFSWRRAALALTQLYVQHRQQRQTAA